MHPSVKRANDFARTLGVDLPVFLAPMAGACPAALSAAVTDGGGMGACGALLMSPAEIGNWANDMRRLSNRPFQMNIWIPDPAPLRDEKQETRLREHLANWGPSVPEEAADVPLLDFELQCRAMLDASPAVISSIMGVFPPEMVAEMKSRGIKWFATVTTVREAHEAAQAGADVIVAQGMEAGGHRGAFDARTAETEIVGLFSLLPSVVDAVDLPVVATGGIADARAIAAALMLGASAVQIGTGFLRAPEAGTNKAWADALAATNPEDTITTRAFSGRLGRAIRTAYTLADGPEPAPYPIQRALTAKMRGHAAKENDIDAMQAWAGQSAARARNAPARDIVSGLWSETLELLG